MTYTQSQTAAISALAAIANRFSDDFFDGGRVSKHLKSLGVDLASSPPVLPDAEAMAGNLAEVKPSDVAGAMKVVSEVDALMQTTNPFGDGTETLGDAINRLAVASR